MDKFKTVFNIAIEQQTHLELALVALLTAGGEKIFSTVVFKCPCNDWNFTYGMVFLLVPALALLVLGYILNNKTWKMFTGLCRPTCYRPDHDSDFRNFCEFVKFLFQITSTALVAPVSWIAVALLNGKYYECAITSLNMTVFAHRLCSGKGPNCSTSVLQKVPCRTDKEKEMLSMIHTESQILGWLLIASILLSSLLVICVDRCKSPVRYHQRKFQEAYIKEERQKLEESSKKHASDLAQRNVDSFFKRDPEDPKAPLTIPNNKAWCEISKFFHFRGPYYSILHEYVENPSLIKASTKSADPDTVMTNV